MNKTYSFNTIDSDNFVMITVTTGVGTRWVPSGFQVTTRIRYQGECGNRVGTKVNIRVKQPKTVVTPGIGTKGKEGTKLVPEG